MTKTGARMGRTFWLGILAALFAFTATAESVYKWKDDQGRVHYSNEPPPTQTGAAKVRLVIPSFGGPAVVSGTAGRGGGVVLYGTASCGYCTAARNHLAQLRVPFTEFDVENDAGARAAFHELGGRGVPLILVGNQRMDGFNAGRLTDMLSNAGYR
jgi:glutaredoxin